MAYFKKFKTLILANTAEAFSNPIGYISNSIQLKDRTKVENVLSQRAIFWADDNKVIVTTLPIPQRLFAYNCNILGLKNAINISPKYSSYSLCQNILKDQGFLEKFKEIIKSNPGIQITTYAYTKEVNDLIERLKTEGYNFSVLEKPHKDISVINYLDSKAGFRETVGPLAGVLIPNGYICLNQEELISKIIDFQKNENAFVIKANEGESGWGLLIAKGETVKNRAKLIRIIKSELKNDGIWKSMPYVIEQYIDLYTEIVGDSPSIELFLDTSRTNINYSCTQLFNKEGEFNGIAMGKDILDSKIQKSMENMALKVGHEYHKLGYKGFFDIDFIVSKDNRLYALETNTRRTGGTHVFDLAKRIFGNKWHNHVFVSNDSFKYGDHKIPLEDVLNRLKDILFPMKKQEGLVLSLFDDEKPILGYILVSSSLERIKQLERILFDYFSLK